MFKNLVEKIVAIGTKRVVTCILIAIVAATGVGLGTYAAINYFNSNSDFEEISDNGVAISGEEIDENVKLSVSFLGEDTNEYKSAFGALNQGSSKVNAIKVFKIALLDKDGNEVEITKEIEVKVDLDKDFTSATGENLLCNTELFAVNDAEFGKNYVKFATNKLGVFSVYKIETVEIDEDAIVDPDLGSENPEDTSSENSSVDSNSSNTSSGTTNNSNSNNNSGVNNNSSTNNSSNVNTNSSSNSGSSDSGNQNSQDSNSSEGTPSTPEPQYPTIVLNQKTTYFGYEGYFATSNYIDDIILVELGIADSNQKAGWITSEYYDVNTGKYILFVFDGSKYLPNLIIVNVDDGAGRGQVPVNTKN